MANGTLCCTSYDPNEEMHVMFFIITNSLHNLTTAGLPIRLTLGLRWHFCCRGPILKPRPVLDSPAQTTRSKVLAFFAKPQNGLVTLIFEKKVFSGGGLGTKLAL